jgi:nucleoside-diphosphate-sugar epimerase
VTVRSKATANVAHLNALAQHTGGELELTEASLDDDKGWAEAVTGCDYIWHLASPVPARLPRNEAELIRPAVDGTLRVLRAAARSGTVRRVVMTSSTVSFTPPARARSVSSRSSCSSAADSPAPP